MTLAQIMRINKYCYKKNIEKALQDKGRFLPSTFAGCQSLTNEVKRARRSDHSKFIAIEQCRWRAAYVCRQGVTVSRQGLQEAIIEACDKRNDVEDAKPQIGVLAQDMETVVPEVVLTADDEMQTKSVDYGKLSAILIEAVKQLSNELTHLKQQINNGA